jgi:3-oxoadipate CoA-transferase beta subunit
MAAEISREELAKRVAKDIPVGAVVNLGIGAPTAVSNFLEPERHVVLHTENGMLAMGPEAHGEDIDPDIINAGKIPVTELPGASYFNHADSFGMMRGGHLDVCVLGAFQVSSSGDLANWITNKPDAIPAVGGAMDLAIGAKNVWVMMDLLTKDGEPKVLKNCTFPLTGVGCVNRIYTGHAVFGVGVEGLYLIEGFADNTASSLSALLGLPVAEKEVDTHA